MLRREIQNQMAMQKSTMKTDRRYRRLISISVALIGIVALGLFSLMALWPDRTHTGAQAAPSVSVPAPQAPAPETRVLSAPRPNPSPKRTGLQNPASRRGVYLNSLAAARPSKIDEVIQKSQALGLNAVVIDVKDNHGVVAYDTQISLAKTISARAVRLDLEELLPKLKAHGLYVIARQVLFYDPKLAQYLKSPIAPWVPASDSRAIQYNLAIAEEVASLGFDEIQFDYVRFPDEGKMNPIYSSRYEAITNFMKQVRARLGAKINLSADVFGRTLWAWNMKKVDPIGQHLESLNPYLNYLSPMIYPSHYETDKLRSDPYGTIKLALQSGKKRQLKLRPFLQAFDMRIPSTMTYGQYIAAQIKAARELGFDSYLFWNPEANYTMLWKVLEQLKAKR